MTRDNGSRYRHHLWLNCPIESHYKHHYQNNSNRWRNSQSHSIFSMEQHSFLTNQRVQVGWNFFVWHRKLASNATWWQIWYWITSFLRNILKHTRKHYKSLHSDHTTRNVNLHISPWFEWILLFSINMLMAPMLL